MPRIYESAFLQLVANHVSPISQINPRRESAADSRHQLHAPTPNMNMRGAAILVCCCRSVLAKVLGEIDCGFLDIQQRLGRHTFRVNHVVAFEFDVEEFEFLVFPRRIAGDGRTVDQHLRRHQYAIDQQGVSLVTIDAAAIQASLNVRRATPPMANVWLGTVSNVFAWATRECLPDPLTGASAPILAENPCEGIKRLAVPRRADPDEEAGHPTFSDEDLARFEAAYAEGTRERLASSVLLYTGLRVGDAARLGRQHVQSDGTIKLRTEKTAADVTIGVVPPLARALAAGLQTAALGGGLPGIDWYRPLAPSIGRSHSAMPPLRCKLDSRGCCLPAVSRVRGSFFDHDLMMRRGLPS